MVMDTTVGIVYGHQLFGRGRSRSCGRSIRRLLAAAQLPLDLTRYKFLYSSFKFLYSSFEAASQVMPNLRPGPEDW